MDESFVWKSLRDLKIDCLKVINNHIEIVLTYFKLNYNIYMYKYNRDNMYADSEILPIKLYLWTYIENNNHNFSQKSIRQIVDRENSN